MSDSDSDSYNHEIEGELLIGGAIFAVGGIVSIVVALTLFTTAPVWLIVVCGAAAAYIAYFIMQYPRSTILKNPSQKWKIARFLFLVVAIIAPAIAIPYAAFVLSAISITATVPFIPVIVIAFIHRKSEIDT